MIEITNSYCKLICVKPWRTKYINYFYKLYWKSIKNIILPSPWLIPSEYHPEFEWLRYEGISRLYVDWM